MASNIVLSNTDFKVVGTRPVRHDGTDKVTGRAKYGADFDAAGLLYAKVLRSPHAHARIKSINTGKAEAAPGVRAVITGQDVPTDSAAARKVMAKDKVLYKGHPVAAVAATSAHDAEQALALIEVEYEILKAATEVRQAMADDADLLHDDQTTDGNGRKATDKHSNIATHFRYEQGDLDQGFAAADVVVEKRVQHGHRPPGLHRAPERRRLLEHQRRDSPSGSAPRAPSPPATPSPEYSTFLSPGSR